MITVLMNSVSSENCSLLPSCTFVVSSGGRRGIRGKHWGPHRAREMEEIRALLFFSLLSFPFFPFFLSSPFLSLTFSSPLCLSLSHITGNWAQGLCTEVHPTLFFLTKFLKQGLTKPLNCLVGLKLLLLSWFSTVWDYSARVLPQSVSFNFLCKITPCLFRALE